MADPILWKHKAMAFAIRCHRHLWGKNNEDPLSFLHLQSISLDLARSLYLGWNKFGQKRSLAGWGLEGDGDFLIPPGVVFPHIIDKELKAIFIIPMETSSQVVMLPGSDPAPVVLGPPGSSDLHETRDLLYGLGLHQKNQTDSIRIVVA